jgi:ankyrin repeat protein
VTDSSAEGTVAVFIEAACVPLDAWHASGTLEDANALLAGHPALADASIHTAAILGDAEAVRRFLAGDATQATVKGGPRKWDALTHLCFSRYLRLEPQRGAGFVRAAAALLEAGAEPTTGFYSTEHEPKPVFESALYGAAGIAHHPELTRLLLERGADPNDEETPYHAPEGYDNRALKVLVESGRLTDESLVTMLVRKHDWHDLDGVTWLLEHGAHPNRSSHWGFAAIHHAVRRDNDSVIIARLLDHGADPRLETGGLSAVAMAARRGRGDLLDLFEERGASIDLAGIDAVTAACARDDQARISAIATDDPVPLGRLGGEAGRLLAEFAGNGNTAGVGHLLDLGVDVGARFEDGDGYWGVARNSTALHVAAWRAQHDTVRLLIERGADVNARDGQDRTPLALAVKACVDSYWTERRSPESVRALLAAGASVGAVPFPSGYREVDELLAPGDPTGQH